MVVPTIDFDVKLAVVVGPAAGPLVAESLRGVVTATRVVVPKPPAPREDPSVIGDRELLKASPGDVVNGSWDMPV